MNAIFSKLSEAGGDMAKVDRNAFPVLNMLNTRYFILPLQDGKTAPVFNPYACGLLRCLILMLVETLGL